MSTPLNPFNVTPELTEAAISQKPEKESFTPPPPLNPAFLTPPLTVETYWMIIMDDHNAHGKQIRKWSRRKKFKPYKYSMGEEEKD